MQLLQVSTSLTSILNEQAQKKFTGILTIRSSFRSIWKLYLCTGRIIWASSNGSLRRLRRLLWQYAPDLDLSRMFDRDAQRSSNLWDYEVIRFFFKRGKLKFEDVQLIIEQTILEVFFEILQQENFESVSYSFQPKDALQLLRMQLTILPVQLLCTKAMSKLQSWIDLNLGSIFPDRIPHIVNAIKLKHSVSLFTYQKLIEFANGDYTLREIACLLKKSDAWVSLSLLPYINRGWLELVQVTDISRAELGKFTISENPSRLSFMNSGYGKKPVVVCVDDCAQTCQQLGCILGFEKSNFIAIRDSTKAILKILEVNPELIFLNIIMPIANGYEICTQLRRVERFKYTPIVMIASHSSLVERTRSRFVGASHFLSKPICNRQVLSIFRKYCDRRKPA